MCATVNEKKQLSRYRTMSGVGVVATPIQHLCHSTKLARVGPHHAVLLSLLHLRS